MLSEDLARNKRNLREKLRFRRKHFAANLDVLSRLGAFRALPAPLATILDDRPPVGGYVAWGDESDILSMLADHPPLALPHHAARVDTMDFRRWAPGETLIKGPWSTQQPADAAEAVVPGLIFCPLVGFDRRGGRLGQGGGHYDRYFARYPAIRRIGIGWSVQEIDAVPAEPTDIVLDAILTEQEFIITGDRL